MRIISHNDCHYLKELILKNSRLLSVFLVAFVDLLGFGLILPLLPYYADAYGATPLIIGLLTASNAAAQLLGAPILGRLSDRFGRRPILLVSIFGTLVGFVLLGVAEPLGNALASQLGMVSAANTIILVLLFTSRVVDGLTGGNISVAQAYITDVTTDEDRAKGLGLIGAAFGLGFIIGPATGGLLSVWGYGVPAFAAAGLAVLNLAAVYFFLPESLTVEKRAELVKSAQFETLIFSEGPLASLEQGSGWAIAAHPNHIWISLCNLPDHFCTLRPVPAWFGCPGDRLYPDLCWGSVRNRPGVSHWEVESEI